jgi:methyltransferase
MPSGATTAGAALAMALAIMVREAAVSARHERALRARGAVEPSGDVFAIMRWAYPACFVAMACEGAVLGPAPAPALAAGVVVFALAKALKVWAIRSLGERWTFRVLVLPGVPLVANGPYRFLRHPNYVAVVGEVVGFGLTVSASVTLVGSVAGFGALMARRVSVEDRALGRR